MLYRLYCCIVLHLVGGQRRLAHGQGLPVLVHLALHGLAGEDAGALGDVAEAPLGALDLRERERGI